MHGNAVSIPAAAAKLGSYASSNQLPYKDGVHCMKYRCCIFSMTMISELLKFRLLRSGRIKVYDWSKLEPAYQMLGEVFTEHPIILEEPQRIANMDEKPLSASSEKIANGKEKVVYDKYVPFVPGMVTQSLTSDFPHVTAHSARWWNEAQERVHFKGRLRRQRVSK